MITLHTYGDSHASHHGSWDKISLNQLEIKINHLGPKLAFSFARDREQVVSEDVSEDDIVVFCYGEIDCRCHIHKHKDNWKQVVEDVSKAYVENAHRNILGKKVIGYIFNVVPPLERENPRNFLAEQKSLVPALGTDEDRKNYTIYMNQMLKKYCDIYGLLFFDVYDKYTDEAGFIKLELSDKNCHIGNEIYMQEFIKNNILGERYSEDSNPNM